MMVNKQHVASIFVIMGAGFVDTLGQRWWSTAEHSKHVHLQKVYNNSRSCHALKKLLIHDLLFLPIFTIESRVHELTCCNSLAWLVHA